jgi:hypothetical protein
MLAKEFVIAELTSFIQEHRLTDSPLMVKLIGRAIEAYEEYRKLVSVDEKNTFVNVRCPECYKRLGVKIEGWDVVT